MNEVAFPDCIRSHKQQALAGFDFDMVEVSKVFDANFRYAHLLDPLVQSSI
jgi:hypothetical protein